jgi:hypothetical protein
MSTIPILMTPPKGIVLVPNGGDPYFEQVSLLFSPEEINTSVYLYPNWGYANALTRSYIYGSNQSQNIANPSTSPRVSWLTKALRCTNNAGWSNMYTAGHAGFNLTGVAFTIEGWFYYTTATPTATEVIFCIKDLTTSATISFYRMGGFNQYFGYSGPDGNTSAFGNSNGTSSWNHFAITRSGTTTSVFMNGTLSGTLTGAWTNSFTDDGSFCVFCSGTATPNANSFAGNLGEIRVTKGTARYTAAFTPPTAEFPKWKDGYPKFTTRPIPNPTFLSDPNTSTTVTPGTWVGGPTVTRRWQLSSTLVSGSAYSDIAGATTTTSPLPNVRSTAYRCIETATIGTLTSINYSHNVTAGWTLG